MDAFECDIWGGVERCPNILWVRSVKDFFLRVLVLRPSDSLEGL